MQHGTIRKGELSKAKKVMKKIFIVEDDDGIRELLETLLEIHQYDVETFGTARSFRAGIPGKEPDLFLLDIMLPDGNGLNLCRDLKSNGETSDVPVVLMSAHADVNHLEGADDFIPKPFDVEELLKRIEKQLV